MRAPTVVWFTGRSGAGKTSIARAVEAELKSRGVPVEVLDGDEIRQSLCRDLGFSKEDRDENVRRAAFVAGLLAKHGVVVLVALISPYGDARDLARKSLVERGISFLEVYVNAPVEVCDDRKPAYPKFPYEPPVTPEIECRTDVEDLETSRNRILEALGPLPDGRGSASVLFTTEPRP